MQICGLILLSWGFLGWCSLVFVVFSLAFSLGIMLCVTHARKKYIADLETLDALFMIGDMLKANMTRAITVMSTTQTIKFSIFFALGCMAGWGARDLFQFHHTYVVNNVEVIDNANREQGRYAMAFGDTHLQFDTTFCADYNPQFPIGIKLEVLVYEDRGSCWSISNHKLGYKIQRQGEINERKETRTAAR